MDKKPLNKQTNEFVNLKHFADVNRYIYRESDRHISVLQSIHNPLFRIEIEKHDGIIQTFEKSPTGEIKSIHDSIQNVICYIESKY